MTLNSFNFLLGGKTMKKLLFVMFGLVIAGSVCAQELNPTVKFNFLRGREAFQKKEYQTALKELKAYVAVDEKNHHALNFLAQTYHKLNNAAEAEKYYLKAIELAHGDTFAPLYEFNFGVLMYDQKKYDKALDYLRKTKAWLR